MAHLRGIEITLNIKSKNDQHPREEWRHDAEPISLGLYPKYTGEILMEEMLRSLGVRGEKEQDRLV